MALEQDMEELKEFLKQKGIGTYIIGIKDPDTNDEAFMSDGSPSWCVGMATLIRHDIIFGGE